MMPGARFKMSRPLRSLSIACLVLAPGSLACGGQGEPASFERGAIFPANSKHNHASCVVELKDGSLLAAWYAGSGERTADDVVIEGSRLAQGKTTWGAKFLMADTPGYPDCNPALFAAPDGSLWLFWPTILDHRWEGALLKYARSDHPENEAASLTWSGSGVLHLTPKNFAPAFEQAIAALSDADKSKYRRMLEQTKLRAADLLYQRLGWMPRVHPLVLPSGRWILPLYSDTFDCSIMAISDDRGATWTASQPLIGFGNIQPSLVRKNDGVLVAFMRDNGPHHHIRLSRSSDDGVSWSPVLDSPFPNPGAGIEAIRLANAHWVLIFNDQPRGRNSLAVSLSDDEGASWKWTRHVERSEAGKGSFHYPSILQASNGSIHVTYTESRPGMGSTITHARFNEAWIKAGDKD
jgi:predicted neuraminidase